MAEYNIPNELNYGIAQGVSIFVEKETAVNVFDPMVCLGNVNDANLTPTLELLEHKSNLFGVNSLDREITIDTKVDITAEFDELVREVAEYLFGSSARTTGVSVAVPFVAAPTFVASSLELNNGDPIVEVISVKPLTGEVEYTEGATGDYEVNLTTAIVTLPVGSAIAANDKVVIIYTVSNTVARYPIYDDVSLRGRVHIVANGGLNPATALASPKLYILLPIAEIRADGDINLLAKTDWRKASLKFTALKAGTDRFGYLYQN